MKNDTNPTYTPPKRTNILSPKKIDGTPNKIQYENPFKMGEIPEN